MLTSRLLCITIAIFAAMVSIVQAAQLKRTQIYAPRNDLYANAFYLNNSSRLLQGQIHFGSRELGEPRISSSSMGRTVWYKYKATRNGRVAFALTSGRMYESPLQMAVYTGDRVDQLKLIQTTQMAGVNGDIASSIVFDAQKGTVYSVQVDKAPEYNAFDGEFQIGVRQFGSEGGLALFYDRPSFLLEENENYLSFLIVNAFRVKAEIRDRPTSLSPYLYIDKSGSSVDVGKSVWYTVKDNYSADLARSGTHAATLVFAASDASTGAALGTTSTPLYLVRMDYSNKPSIFVRFERNGQGVRLSEGFQSRVFVKNTSDIPAQSCGFITGRDAYGLTYREYRPSGSAVIDRPFNLAAGQERVFDVSVFGSIRDWYDWVVLTCWNYYAVVNKDDLASMWAYQQHGLAANLTISPVADNNYKQIAIPDFGFKSVVVKMKNIGEYSGEFVITFDDDEYLSRANVSSFCVSDLSGTCLAAPGSKKINIDLAPGEEGYVTFRVERGNDSVPGLVYISAQTFDIPIRVAGYGGFEIVRQ